ncbi:hypothetical protein JCM3766R1_003992 [Sporobolomyces carnicolor]
MPPQGQAPEAFRHQSRLLDLPNDLLLVIFEIVYEDPSLAISTLHSEYALDRRLAYLLDDESAAKRVRHLEVAFGDSHARLVKLVLARLTGLTHLSLTCIGGFTDESSRLVQLGIHQARSITHLGLYHESHHDIAGGLFSKLPRLREVAENNEVHKILTKDPLTMSQRVPNEAFVGESTIPGLAYTANLEIWELASIEFAGDFLGAFERAMELESVDPRELPLKRLALPVSLRDLWEVEQGEDFCRANFARLLSLLARTSIEQLELVIPELFPSAVDGCSVNSI